MSCGCAGDAASPGQASRACSRTKRSTRGTMNFLNALKLGALKLSQRSLQPITNTTFKRFRKPSPCDVCLYPQDKRPCFDIRKVSIERGNQCHSKLIRSFLYSHYWPREPSVVGLWMPLDFIYNRVWPWMIAELQEWAHYTASPPERNHMYFSAHCLKSPNLFNKVWPWMIAELQEWAHYTASPPERNHMYFSAHCLKSPNLFNKVWPWMIAELQEWAHYTASPPERNHMYFSAHCLKSPNLFNKVWPWMIAELQEWAHYTASPPERNHMYFSAHCLKSPNLFNKYHVDYIYHIEILGTAAEVTGQGVATLLLRAALAQAQDLRYPLAQIVSVSHAKCCERCDMRQEWSMDYKDFVDQAGTRVFFPRRPHHAVGLYVKAFDPKQGAVVPCKMQ
ncbi:Uncharacterized protein OBRU01_12460 [Operophtera brumata]|uniref:N-acetyltransferase domain-containing protein n=1 Tax=Operophtera brumata TaxID=104452 RepID=A0A0L7LAI5_OPEBR|nr:Uncharacterized protein OBRU01_12460 [Operophtera brumata]